MIWFVVGIGVDFIYRAAIPSLIRSFLPELGAIEIGRSDAKEGEGGDAEG